jgi:hypothetical protein
MKTEHDTLEGDLIQGMTAIAAFVGESERRCYFLATNRLLPGVFKQGGLWRGLKSKIREGFERAAEGGSSIKTQTDCEYRLAHTLGSTSDAGTQEGTS